MNSKCYSTVIEDASGEVLAVMIVIDTAYIKNITKWYSEINLNDLDETGDGWEEISVEEAENIIANGKVMYTNKKD